jgi:transposase
MAITDGSSLPIAIHIGSARPHEVTRVDEVLDSCFVDAQPEHVIGDKAYDSDPLDQRLAQDGIEMIAPHRRNRTRSKNQDGRPLRRYKRRWKVERFFAWLQNYRCVLVRHLGQLGQSRWCFG